jgi:nucleoside-diphosphate-sugar epimerase
MRALVVGGTGPSGPHVVSGLLERGFDVSIFHRGVHEPVDLGDVRHIHGDPHFVDTIDAALGSETFDVVVAMYGRVVLLADALAGRCGQFVSVGGTPAYLNIIEPGRTRPWGTSLPLREDAPLADSTGEPPKLARLVLAAERAVLEHCEAGGFRGSVIRTPAIHGPRNVMPHEWLVLQRLADGRPTMLLPDSGLGIMARCAAPNAAAVVLACVDHPDTSAGQVYNCSDDDQYSWRTWVDLVAEAAGGEIEVVGLPTELSGMLRATLTPLEGYNPQTMLDTRKAREELGYRQAITASKQIRDTVAWLLEHPPVLEELVAWIDPFDYEREDRLLATYRRAIEQVVAEAGWDAPELHHPMPHPKQTTVGKDERGR